MTIDGKTETYSDKRGHIVHLGQCDAGKVVTLDFPMDSEYETGNVKLQMYALNQDISIQPMPSWRMNSCR